MTVECCRSSKTLPYCSCSVILNLVTVKTPAYDSHHLHAQHIFQWPPRPMDGAFANHEADAPLHCRITVITPNNFIWICSDPSLYRGQWTQTMAAKWPPQHNRATRPPHCSDQAFMVSPLICHISAGRSGVGLFYHHKTSQQGFRHRTAFVVHTEGQQSVHLMFFCAFSFSFLLKPGSWRQAFLKHLSLCSPSFCLLNCRNKMRPTIHLQKNSFLIWRNHFCIYALITVIVSWVLSRVNVAVLHFVLELKTNKTKAAAVALLFG